MKFASEEIRTKAVNAYLEGKATSKQLADILGYSIASICNWVRTYKRENRLAAKPNGHRYSCFSDEELEALKHLMVQHPDMTLVEIRDHFGKSCSPIAIHAILKKLGFVYKKNSQGQRTRSQRRKTSS